MLPGCSCVHFDRLCFSRNLSTLLYQMYSHKIVDNIVFLTIKNLLQRPPFFCSYGLVSVITFINMCKEVIFRFVQFFYCVHILKFRGFFLRSSL